MKKIVWFIVLTLLLFTIFLVSNHYGAIWDAIVAFSEGKIFWYLLGATTMFAASLLSGNKIHLPKRKSKEKKAI